MTSRLVVIGLLSLVVACDHPFESIDAYQLPYEEQVEQDLKPFLTHGISREQLQQTYAQSPEQLVVVRISGNGTMVFETRSAQYQRVDVMVRLIQQAIYRFGPLPEMVLLLNVMDEPHVRKDSNSLVPIFSFSTTPEFADITFPMIASGDFLRMDEVLREIKEKATPFEQKKDLLVWRGSQTGGRYDETNWREFPRSKLVLFCQSRPDLCDAGFSAFTQVTPAGKESIKKTVGLKAPISMENMQAYKYIASLDGNAWPDRLPRLLAANSLLFKENSKFYSFFDLALQPGVHYVSLKSDMSDIEEKIMWARNNPAKVAEIIQNANQFAEQYLRQSAVEAYVYKVLLRYSQLLK